jgi:signal transduction histidine kinase
VLLGLEIRAAWSAPILSSTDAVLGTFDTYFREPRAPSPAEQELVELLSNTAAVAIERQRAVDAARDADRRTDEFLAMLAHELRTPLAPIGSAAKLLGLSDLDSATIDRARSVVERQVGNMTRLIDDLLDVSRITRGVVKLRLRTIDLAQIAAHAAETVSPLLEKRKHRLNVSVPEAPVPVSADAARMEQVIVNLLANAAKFTATGGHIAIRVAAGEDDTATIRVADNGRGIAPELLPRVFDMFTQGSRTLDRTDGGLGVGLTVAQRLTQMHGGTISVRSEGSGCGSEFTVTLPRACGGLEETLVPTLPSVRSCRILIVEDQPDAAEMLALLLTADSHEVHLAHDGHSALVEAARCHPDVMLIDIGLPGMSGYDLAERIRSDRALARVCLIALTGYDRPQDRSRALSSGFDHHLVKPVDVDALTRLIAGALQS